MNKKFLLAFAPFLLSGAAYAQDDLTSLSLEGLMNVDITSVSKKAEKSSNAAAAIYVISNEDIKRSGAVNLPEVFRMVPGMQVGQIDSNKWSISARGFDSQFSNKLLVLIDGRSVYTPFFSGVYWEIQDTPLEDIERIEVIRGPGATLWGANAVNGVINIITKDAQDTQGTYLEAGFGTLDKVNTVVRHGGQIGSDVYYRNYAKYYNGGETKTVARANADDNWDMARSGFRVDWEKSAEDSVDFIGDVYYGTIDENSITAGISENDVSGANVIGKWEHAFSKDSELSVQGYADYISRNEAKLGQRRLTLDLEAQHVRKINDKNEIIWGMGYRYVRDDIDNKISPTVTDQSRSDNLYSAFIQDKYTISPDKLFVTFGTKLEHNNYSGFEYQPSVRGTWLVNNNNTLWGAVSRAVRTPNRFDSSTLLSYTIPSVPPIRFDRTGIESFNSEDLTAYELGFRSQVNQDVSIDATVFFNDYTDLRTTENGTSSFEFGTVVIPGSYYNNAKAESYGLEVASEWKVTEDLKLKANYTYFDINTSLEDGVPSNAIYQDEDETVKNQFYLGSYLSLPNNITWDNHFYYVDRRVEYNIDEYLRFDTRLAWQATDGVEISFVGQNLLQSTHSEATDSTNEIRKEIPRSFYGKVALKF